MPKYVWQEKFNERDDSRMEKVDFLPLGTVVVLNGSIKKVMIAQRAVYVPVNEDETDIKYFEYGAVLYPEGLVDGQLVYFNSEDVYKVIAVGYTDADDELLVEEINEALEKVENEPKKVTEIAENSSSTVDPFSGLSEKFDKGE
ncbi:hypothetical protein LmYK1_15090 [Ligilactobacillus murinus]|nr:hypothetical protein C822_000061 [Ligilactobacillus murinus ASF361]BDI02269.1 hypothetical protein LmYK1_15090 [Ligilactobacillus murinus]GFI63184.1 hypothetical protein IMSAG117_00595 [Lactobacillaceae bacterium]